MDERKVRPTGGVDSQREGKGKIRLPGGIDSIKKLKDPQAKTIETTRTSVDDTINKK